MKTRVDFHLACQALGAIINGQGWACFKANEDCQTALALVKDDFPNFDLAIHCERCIVIKE